MESAWKLTDVTLAGRGTPRLDGLSASISQVDTAIVGPSGSGKTSLLNLLVGFEHPESGQIDRPAPDRDSSRLPLYWAPATGGLWPHLTVAEHLDSVRPATGGTTRDLLAAFELDGLQHARPGSLSQGERSRLSVARAIATGARRLVLDEPLAHVDPALLPRCWEVLRRHCRATQTQLIFATHHPESAVRDAQSVLCLDRGRLIYAGSVHALYDQPGTPELAALLGPFNWLTEADQNRWLARSDVPVHQQCVRPERLQVAADAAGDFEVEEERFAGSSSEVDVRNPRDGQTRTFVHRPPRGLLRRGDRVSIRLLMLLLLVVSCCGCGWSEGPRLAVRRETYWSMPPDGPRVPAPRGIGVSPEGEYLVLDNAGRLLVFDQEGVLQRKWWMPEYSVGKPEGVCFLKDGRIAVADTHYHRIVLFNHDGEVSGTFGTLGTGPGEFIYPVSVIQDEDEFLYVCEYGNNNDRAQKLTTDGKFVAQIGSYGTADGQFQRPSGAALYDGHLYIVDAFNNRIQVFDTNGTLTNILGVSDDPAAELYYPYDISVSRTGELFVVEYGAGRVTRMDRTGRILGRYGSAGSGPAQFATPWGLTVDPRGRVYVCDTGNRRIVELEL